MVRVKHMARMLVHVTWLLIAVALAWSHSDLKRPVKHPSLRVQF